MNDGLDKKIALGLALTLALLLATGVYWFAEPSRQKGAADKYKLAAAEIFAQNCFFCHSDQGLGGVGPSLRQTKLDEEGLRRTISRGVVIMPAWAREEGGTLNPFQVQGLVAFILDWDEKLMGKALAPHSPPPPPTIPPLPPPPYAGMKNPFPWGDTKAIEMGHLLYEKMCINCHPVLNAPPSPSDFANSVYSRQVEEHADYYFWMVSEGRVRGYHTMLAYKNFLPEKQRWQVVNYVWYTAPQHCAKGHCGGLIFPPPFPLPL